ncbi:egl-9 [Symbiodinium sp. CCMP2592]|nr:egl-9 [Symbiodinium sp. CCMP2592]
MCQNVQKKSATHWLVLPGQGGGKTEVRSAPAEDAPAVGTLPDCLLRVQVPHPTTGGWCRISPEDLQRLQAYSFLKDAWVLVDGESARRVGFWKDSSEDEDSPEVEFDSSIFPCWTWEEAESRCLLPLEEGDPSEAWQERLQSLVARVSDEALIHLLQYGYAIVDNALPSELCATLRHELDTLLEQGQMWDSQSYSLSEGAVHHNISETTLDFLEARTHAPTFAEIEKDQGLLRILRRLPALKGLSMQHLRLQVNRGNGGCYTMHTDSGVSEPADGAVQVLRATALFYLNEGWQEEHGGELRLYPYPLPPVRIAPLSGRLVLFEPRMVHEVLPNFHMRYCFTLWCATSMTSTAASSTFLNVETMTDFEAASSACIAFRRSAGTLAPQLESVPSPLRSLFFSEVRPLLVRYVFRDCELQSACRSHDAGPQKDLMLQGISQYHQKMKELNPAWFRLLLELLPSAATEPARTGELLEAAATSAFTSNDNEYSRGRMRFPCSLAPDPLGVSIVILCAWHTPSR